MGRQAIDTVRTLSLRSLTGTPTQPENADSQSVKRDREFRSSIDRVVRGPRIGGMGPGARVLDVGAGRGAVGKAAVVRGCAVTRSTRRRAWWPRLAAGHREILVLHQEAGELHFPDGSFDLVTAGFLMQELDDPRLALAEFHRVLVPGGTIALSLEQQGFGRLGWLQDLTREFLGCLTRGAGPRRSGGRPH